jgi:8-oxo-dGTP diphosphatase
VLLVSKRSAPAVFYLPGGKQDGVEEPLETLARELAEELGVAIVDSELLGDVSDHAALEEAEMGMKVYLVEVDGVISARGELRESRGWAQSARPRAGWRPRS